VPLAELVINEVMSQNDGAWIDENGEADDWLEVVNRTSGDLSLAGYALHDESAGAFPLPARVLRAGQSVLIWVDSDPDQGELHAPFKLSSTGDRLHLVNVDGVELDVVDVPALEVNQTLARFPNAEGPLSLCRYATPGRPNPSVCGAEAPPPLVDDVDFAHFEHPEPFPAAPAGLAINELELRPALG
jgi:hypothetical protein